MVDFDHNSAAHAADTVASFRALREAGPLVWSEAHGGYWITTTYETTFEAARHAEMFSSARTLYGGEGLEVLIPKTPMHRHLPNEADPPEHRKYRLPLNKILTPSAVEDMEPVIDAYVAWFIDEIIESGSCDFASVVRVPTIITIDWLGLPVEDWHRYASAHHGVMMSTPGSPDFQRVKTLEFPYLWAQMRDVIHRRHVEPESDVISYLSHLVIDDRAITEEETFALVELLISGGVNTTASLVSQTLVWLYQNRDVREQLIADPTLLDRAVEEFLRFFSPNQTIARTARCPSSFQGGQVELGDRLLLAWASANRDPAAFDDPDLLNIERWPNPHAAFGLGVHRCAGSHLARGMSRALIGQILERMPDYEIDLDRVEIYSNQAVHSGYTKIPARFTPGQRRTSAPPDGAPLIDVLRPAYAPETAGNSQA